MNKRQRVTKHAANPYYLELEGIRNRLGLTREAFAERLGVKVGTYSNYRSARKPGKSVILLARRIANNV